MDNTSSTEAQVELASVLEPHHEVLIEYPCLDLLQGQETLTFPKVHNQSKRFQPLPLVPDETIEDNYPWINNSDGLRHTLFRSTRIAQGGVLPEGVHENKDDLLMCVEELLQYHGRTVIRMVTHAANAEAGEVPAIATRICLTVMLMTENGEYYEHDSPAFDSMMPLETLPDMTVSDDEPEWVKDLSSVLIQKLDRDVRHVERMLDEQGEDYNDWVPRQQWKSPRQVPIDECIPLIAKVLTKTELDEHNETLLPDERIEDCPVCYAAYGDDESRAVMLPCSNKHCICAGCFTRVCEGSGVIKSTCPHCRQKLTPDELASKLGPNALDINAYYTYDPRYTAFENAERSYARIDRELPGGDFGYLIRVDKDKLVESWNAVVPRGFNDDGTPDRLIHIKAPESFFFLTSFLKTVKELDGKMMMNTSLYHVLLHNALATFRDEFLRNGSGKFISESDREALDMSVGFVSYFLRPGYDVFMEKSLNRVIMLPMMRVCHDGDHDKGREANETGMHFHESAFTGLVVGVFVKCVTED